MKKFGLIGYPLGHSFSQGYFNEKFANEGIDARYDNYEIASIGDFPAVVEENPDLCGLNVTIPYKEKVISYLDEVDWAATEIGAVNVVKVVRHKGSIRLVGYNSDVIGFVQSIEPLIESHHKKALVLGTGGAAKAVVYGLRSLGVEPTLVSRRPHPDRLNYDQLTPACMDEYTVVVNCTPVGMYPRVDECPDIPYEGLTPRHLLYDLVYNPDQTLFLKKGAAQGAQVKNGLEMLLLQAFAAWEFWNK